MTTALASLAREFMQALGLTVLALLPMSVYFLMGWRSAAALMVGYLIIGGLLAVELSKPRTRTMRRRR